MSDLGDSARELLGADAAPKYFTPVVMQQGMTIGDQYRHMRQLMADDAQFQETRAKSTEAQVVAERSTRELEALKNESQILAGISSLDPTDDEFETKVADYIPMSVDNKAVERALDLKMGARETTNKALGALTANALESGMTMEQFEAQQTSAKELLRRGNITGYGKLLFLNERNAAQRRAADAARAGRGEELRSASSAHIEALSKINVPMKAEALDPEFFQGELAGDSAKLPGIAQKYLTSTLMEAVEDNGALVYANVDALNQILPKNAETGKPFADKASAVAFLQSSDLNPFLGKMATDALSMDVNRFVAQYGPRSEEAPDAKRSTAFLKGLHGEVNQIKKFSATQEKFRAVNPEFAQAAQAAYKERVAKANAMNSRKLDIMAKMIDKVANAPE